MTTIEDIKNECRAIIVDAEKATPGPWIAHKVGLGDVFSPDHTWIASVPLDASIAAVRRGCGEAGGEKENADDASFIAAARSFTPKAAKALLDTITVLESVAKTKFGWDGDCGVTSIVENALEDIRMLWEESK